MDKSECALCHRRRDAFSCADCTSAMLQQRRTMLAALQADVAVLRKKTGFALSTKSALVDAELRLDRCMKQVERLAERVMKTREQLCSERIAVVERTSKLEERTVHMEEAQHKLQHERQRAESLHAPVLECLDYQVQWADENAAGVRGDRLRELFALFALTPQEEDNVQGEDEDEDDPLSGLPDEREGVSEEMRQRKTRANVPVFFRTIVGLPLPKSGKYENVPPEVVAAALGKVIHLLHCLVKYLKITYPHPMEFNGSFSTIGNTSEGAGCHTLYPDGSVGFERGLSMLHENVAFLCACQGVSKSDVHPTDLLGNLLEVYKSSRLGTLCDNQEANELDPDQSATIDGVAASALMETSQTLTGSIEILPHYS
ncbi:uv radiation resistance associated protein [Phytophthora cinnamomi]|uniref:uv radiation resistance associated protein n=1 Tax=Phytophthora cinnamomi TaxID=4785 RepID=UPI003559B23C|nr:uv radiation resistance associated protein [Phytophthora cinnamomi]